MKKLLIILVVLVLLCIAVYAFTSAPKPVQPAPSQAILDAIKGDLSEWGDGRWHNWDAIYYDEHDTLVLTVAADPNANEMALNSYCQILTDIAKEHAPSYKFAGYIFVLGEIKKRC